MAGYDPYLGFANQGLDLSNISNIGSYMPISGNQVSGSNWFNDLGGLAGIFNLGLQGLQGYTGLQSAKLAKQQLGLANKQFDFEKNLVNRNLANQAQVINNAYDAAGQAALGLLGGIDARTGQAINPDAETVARAEENIKKSYVSGSPI